MTAPDPTRDPEITALLLQELERDDEATLREVHSIAPDRALATLRELSAGRAK